MKFRFDDLMLVSKSLIKAGIEIGQDVITEIKNDVEAMKAERDNSEKMKYEVKGHKGGKTKFYVEKTNSNKNDEKLFCFGGEKFTSLEIQILKKIREVEPSIKYIYRNIYNNLEFSTCTPDDRYHRFLEGNIVIDIGDLQDCLFLLEADTLVEIDWDLISKW